MLIKCLSKGKKELDITADNTADIAMNRLRR